MTQAASDTPCSDRHLKMANSQKLSINRTVKNMQYDIATHKEEVINIYISVKNSYLFIYLFIYLIITI